MNLSEAIEFDLFRNGLYSGSEGADVFVYSGGIMQLYMNGRTKHS